MNMGGMLINGCGDDDEGTLMMGTLRFEAPPPQQQLQLQLQQGQQGKEQKGVIHVCSPGTGGFAYGDGSGYGYGGGGANARGGYGEGEGDLDLERDTYSGASTRDTYLENRSHMSTYESGVSRRGLIS